MKHLKTFEEITISFASKFEEIKPFIKDLLEDIEDEYDFRSSIINGGFKYSDLSVEIPLRSNILFTDEKYLQEWVNPSHATSEEIEYKYNIFHKSLTNPHLKQNDIELTGMIIEFYPILSNERLFYSENFESFEFLSNKYDKEMIEKMWMLKLYYKKIN